MGVQKKIPRFKHGVGERNFKLHTLKQKKFTLKDLNLQSNQRETKIDQQN